VVGAALGAAAGRAVLLLPERDSDEYQRTIATVGDVQTADGYDTEVITLDSLELPRLDVLKLDIEGAECDALLGARETLVRCRPRLLLVEVIEENLARFGRTGDDLASLLESFDYSHEQVGGPYEAPMWTCRPRRVSDSMGGR
jgi:hypothetical protein